MDKFTYIANSHVNYIDELYSEYKNNPENLDPSWKQFFEGFDFATKNYSNGKEGDETSKEAKVRKLISSYRLFAHLVADTNPIRKRRQHKVEFDLKKFNLGETDLNQKMDVASVVGLKDATLRHILEKLKRVYTESIGFEFHHIRNDKTVRWLAQKIEKEAERISPSMTEKKEIIDGLIKANVFENFLHTKFLGQKRFSLEGSENTINALKTIIYEGAERGAEEVVIGMAHRGRLNVLVNIMGKPYKEIFTEFEGNIDLDLSMGDGDVKYHLGYNAKIKTSGNKSVYVKLCPNPSHLEAVNPVVLGHVRAQIDDDYNGDSNKVIPIVIHGDAAMSGQGIVYECIQMSKLPGYSTGGAIHFVINNQIGFTTDFEDGRSSIYCTDLAKIVDAPLLHVNGDDAEAVHYCAKLAIEYRQKFKKDFFIDMLGYRRHGHNESDEPKFTQPMLYASIDKHPNPKEIYKKKLVQNNEISLEEIDKIEKDFKNSLQKDLDSIKSKKQPFKPQKVDVEWVDFRKSTPEDFDESPDTGIPEATLQKIGRMISTVPDDFKPLRQIQKVISEREDNFFNKKELGWADAELLAYGTYLEKGNVVRMSGQDVKRGTFSHRHAYFFDSVTNEPYCGLNTLNSKSKLHIYNSLLSEYGVLGFEYGYSMSSPNALVIWEAQFGDFVNGAQIIIDQFIMSAESKWQLMNGLVMLVPHGYEGQGPEHSSARMERFLQMVSEENVIIANLTSSANLFHVLRRQTAWNFRKPTIIFTPKSLLRYPGVASPVKHFIKGRFKEIFPDNYVTNKDVKRVILCTGKVYFDLLNEQQKNKIKNVAIIRIEQIYPFPRKQLDKLLKKYPNPELVWVQEESKNMGAWTYLLSRTSMKFSKVIARKNSSSPATGYAKVHKQEQQSIIKNAFELSK